MLPKGGSHETRFADMAYSDLVNANKDTRTADEVAFDIMKKGGLKFKKEVD